MTTLGRGTFLAAALVLVSVPAVAQGWPPTQYWSDGQGTTFFNSRAVVRDPALAARLLWPAVPPRSEAEELAEYRRRFGALR